MTEPENNGKEIERSQNSLGQILRTLEELEQENKRLHDEKVNLLDIESKLESRVNKEVDDKRHQNYELRTEVEKLQRICEELTQILNKKTD